MPLFRFYTPLFLKLLRRDPQMLFLSGPRQSGKTTVAKQIGEAWGESLYLNWDRLPDRQRILAGPDRLAETMGLERVSRKRQLLILDEFHKYVKWKDYLKSLYDSYHERLQILVTGSARLGVFHRGGDSLMGRYFPMNFHPLTLGELLEPHTPLEETLFRVEPLSVSSSLWEALLQFGGFPDPFQRQERTYWRRWQSVRFQLLFEKEIADLTQVRQISQLELLARLLQEQAGQLTSYANLSNKLQVSAPTTKEWCTLLHAVFYAFPLRPWSRNLSKALIKEPKWFLYDWSTLKEDGSRLENLVATHLLKNVETWNDLGLGQFGLHFVRDQLGREVAFLLVREDEPWMLLEVKKSDLQISSHLKYFAEILKPRYALQLVETLPQTVESFLEWDSSPRLLSLPSFLSQLL